MSLTLWRMNPCLLPTGIFFLEPAKIHFIYFFEKMIPFFDWLTETDA